jgi:GntR family carbon starvation induced transcriptional regulator
MNDESDHDGLKGPTNYDRLRKDILHGMLAPGERLKLEALKDRYSTSINTLRESLARLAAQGLVVAEDQRGFMVKPASLEDLLDVISMRLLLESEGIRRAFAVGDLNWEASLVAAHYKLAKAEALVIQDPVRHAAMLERYNLEFHQALIGAAGSSWLLTLWRLMYDQSHRYRMLAFKVGAFPRERSQAEHRELLEAALARDAERAVRISVAHAAKGEDLYRELEDVTVAPAKTIGLSR